MQNQNITLILSNLILERTLNLPSSELPGINPKNQTDLTCLVTGHTGAGAVYPHESRACPFNTMEAQGRTLSLGVRLRSRSRQYQNGAGEDLLAFVGFFCMCPCDLHQRYCPGSLKYLLLGPLQKICLPASVLASRKYIQISSCGQHSISC